MKPMTDFTQLKIITKSRGAAKEVGFLVKQQGAALVVALIMLVLMTLVGITAMQVTTVQEKMVANSRDLNVAFQAAEVALLRGEHYVKNMQDAIFTTTCKGSGSTIGLCKPGQSTPIWTTISWSDTDPVTLEYGNEQENKQIPASETSVDNIQPLPAKTVAKQPRYIIEDITSVSGGGQANLSKGLYRITAQGYGQAVNDNGQPLARVMLQSVFKK
ncbi:MAG: hypothetical protein EKK68_12940 [Candidatus Competibacteraceae bacterium]|nr:MAG: hypothetical protein EKK68_12940 [Candidatus Competibacteraceae bacterium]